MGMIFALLEKSCVLVTLTFVLTRTRFFAHLLRPRLPAREQATALLVFLLMGFMEEAVAHQHGLMNVRIVAVCAAGLLAGPGIGGIVGLAVTAMACHYHPYPLLPIGISMFLAGFCGGLLHRWRPTLALRPTTGFVLGASVSLLRYGLALAFANVLHNRGSAQSLPMEAAEAVMHGLGVALILLVVAQVQTQESQARAAAVAEVRALQARMNPHFLFNALNTLSALSTIDPRAIPRATARLGLFLRASLDQHERPFVCLQAELDVVGAYLDVEAMRMGERLHVEQSIAPHLLGAFVPPFLLQPLVENAVCHGIQPGAQGGLIRVEAHEEEAGLVLIVSDTGIGMTPEARTRLFHTDGCHVHALTLLRRRLQGLYGNNFLLSVASERGKGTTVVVRIPVQSTLPLSEQEVSPNRRMGMELQEAGTTLLR